MTVARKSTREAQTMGMACLCYQGKIARNASSGSEELDGAAEGLDEASFPLAQVWRCARVPGSTNALSPLSALAIQDLRCSVWRQALLAALMILNSTRKAALWKGYVIL